MLVLGAVVVIGCARPAPPPRGEGWGAFPANAAEVSLARSRLSRRAPSVSRAPELDAAAIRSHPGLRGHGAIAVGWPQIAAWLDRALGGGGGKGSYLLFGVHHDSAGQMDAVRRLIGPGGVPGLTHVFLEQMRGGGRWDGAPPADQAGDDAALARWLDTGSARDFAALEAAQELHDYAAWKFGYVDGVLAVAAAARARTITLRGCDAPRALLDKSHLPEDAKLRARELHCGMVMRQALSRRTAPARVALAWGQAHLEPGALAAVLPEDARVVTVHVVGQRADADRAATALVAREPVLLPTGDAQAILLLPEPCEAGVVDRVRRPRTEEDDPLGAILAQTTEPASLYVSTGTAVARTDLRPGRAVLVTLPAGAHAYVVRATSLAMVGSVVTSADTSVSLRFDPGRRTTEVVQSGP